MPISYALHFGKLEDKGKHIVVHQYIECKQIIVVFQKREDENYFNMFGYLEL